MVDDPAEAKVEDGTTSRRDVLSIITATAAIVALGFSVAAFVLASDANTDADRANRAVETMPIAAPVEEHAEEMGDEAPHEDEAPHDDQASHGDGTGMFAFGEAADPASATVTIEVDAVDIAFEPTELVVEHEDVVLFKIHNTGEVVHDFTIGDEATQAAHAEEMAQFTLKQLSKGKGHDHGDANAVLIQPGETMELAFRFTAHEPVIFGCHVPGHYEAGMRGVITVN